MLHDVWLTEGYSSAAFNATQRATYPLASYVETDIVNRSAYHLGFGRVFGHQTSVPMLLRVCNVNLMPAGNNAAFSAATDYVNNHWRPVGHHPLATFRQATAG